jgi:hypothetical protein
VIAEPPLPGVQAVQLADAIWRDDADKVGELHGTTLLHIAAYFDEVEIFVSRESLRLVEARGGDGKTASLPSEPHRCITAATSLGGTQCYSVSFGELLWRSSRCRARGR